MKVYYNRSSKLPIKIEPCCKEISTNVEHYYIDPEYPPMELGMAEESSGGIYSYDTMKYCFKCGSKIEFIEDKG